MRIGIGILLWMLSIGLASQTPDEFLARAKQRTVEQPKDPESWHNLGAAYFDLVARAKPVPAPATAIEYVADGLKAEDRALELSPNYFEALTFKNLLLRLQANYETNPEMRRKLIAQADAVRAKAQAILEAQQRSTPSAPPSAPSSR